MATDSPLPGQIDSDADSSDSDSSEDDSKSDSNSDSDSESASQSESEKSEDDEVQRLENAAMAQTLGDMDESDDDHDLPIHTPSRAGRVIAILRQYAQLSTTHGANHMGEAHSIRVILFWSVILMACMVCFGWLFSTTLRKYFAFPTQVQINMAEDQRFFPSVTICNLNPYKRTAMYDYPELAALMQAFEVALE